MGRILLTWLRALSSCLAMKTAVGYFVEINIIVSITKNSKIGIFHFLINTPFVSKCAKILLCIFFRGAEASLNLAVLFSMQPWRKKGPPLTKKAPSWRKRTPPWIWGSTHKFAAKISVTWDTVQVWWGHDRVRWIHFGVFPPNVSLCASGTELRYDINVYMSVQFWRVCFGRAHFTLEIAWSLALNTLMKNHI